MVTIINYIVNENSDGETFISLELQGDITMIQSKSSGKFYATSKRARLASTFDEATAKLMIGQQIPGRIKKVQCTPYTYVIPESGNEVQLDYTYTFVPADEDNVSYDSKPNLTVLGNPLQRGQNSDLAA